MCLHSGTRTWNINRAALPAIKRTRPRLVFLLRVLKANKQKVIKMRDWPYERLGENRWVRAGEPTQSEGKDYIPYVCWYKCSHDKYEVSQSIQGATCNIRQHISWHHDVQSLCGRRPVTVCSLFCVLYILRSKAARSDCFHAHLRRIACL